MALRFLNSGYFAGSVGIGTDSPLKKLSVSGGDIAVNNGNGFIVGAATTGNTEIGRLSASSGQLQILTESTRDIKFGSTTYGNIMFLEGTNGKVGIGTDDPERLLSLYSDNAETTPRLLIEQDGTGDAVMAFSLTSGQGWSMGIDNSGGDAFMIHNSAGGVDSSSQFVILNSGNVGIGTTSPAAKLEIITTRTGTPSSDTNIKVTDDTAQAADVGGSINFTGKYTDAGAYLSGSPFIRASKKNATTSDYGYGLKFGVRGTGSGTSNVAMTIDSDSNVGIGTTSPDYLLDVEGSANNADIAIRINNTFDDNLATSNPTSVLWLNAASNNGYLRVHGAPANTAAKHQIDLGSTAGSSFLTFSPSGEKMRITNAGGISFGSTGSSYGASGQVLTSAGDASPTWTTPTTGTVTGSGSATQVAFWDTTSSLSGSNNLYWDSTEGHLGINDSSPGSPLKVFSGTTEDSIYTVDINHVRNDANVATHAMRINVDLSGADTTTADITNSGLFVDLDSSANGDASNEQRLKGVNADVRFTGFTDSAISGNFYVESNYIGAKTAIIAGVLSTAVHDTSSTNGGVSNMYGVIGTSSIQDLGDVDNAFGGYFAVDIGTSRGNANVGVTKGVEGHINIDKAATIAYGEMMAVSGIIDNNEGTVPTFGNQYLFKGDYQGTKGGNAYGIYTEGDKHYFDGNIGIGNTSATSRLTVQESGITTKIATVTIGDTTAGASLTLRGGSPTIYFDRTGTDPENKILMDSAGLEFKTGTLDAEGDVDFKINPDGSLNLANANLSNQENTDIDSAAAEVVAEVAISYTAAFFDFVVKKGTNVRSGTVYACHDGTNVEFTETSTNDLGDTSDVTLSVDKTSTNLRLIATVTSDDWSVKSLIRAI